MSNIQLDSFVNGCKVSDFALFMKLMDNFITTCIFQRTWFHIAFLPRFLIQRILNKYFINKHRLLHCHSLETKNTNILKSIQNDYRQVLFSSPLPFYQITKLKLKIIHKYSNHCVQFTIPFLCLKDTVMNYELLNACFDVLTPLR